MRSTCEEGNDLGKIARNCMKIRKSTLLGLNRGDMEDQANFSSSGGYPQSHLTRGNPELQNLCISLLSKSRASYFQTIDSKVVSDN